MNDVPTVRTKTIEVKVVDVCIELSKDLYDYLMECKAVDEEKDKREYSLGEYMEMVYNDQLDIIQKQTNTIALLQAQLGIKPTSYNALDKMNKISPEIKEIIKDPSYI